MVENNDYIELECEIIPLTDKNKNILIAFLNEKNFEGFWETEKGIKAYISEKDAEKTDFENLKTEISDLSFNVKISVNNIKDENWNEKWTKNYFKPVIFGNKLVVRASFHEKNQFVENEIIIDPKTAFGTGNHATTYMLVEEILNLDLKGKKVLDMGTGTGILAILSKMKGAGYTLAVDNDVKAVWNTKENVIVNNTPDIEVIEGTMQSINDIKFDFVYENIWKNTVISDMPLSAKIVNEGGILLTSGFYYEDFNEVKNSGEQNGFRFVSVKEQNGWAVVKFEKTR